MDTQKKPKIRTLYDLVKTGTIVLASWLEKHGISRDLQQHYRKRGWIESFGRGAYYRHGDEISWLGGLNAIQNQADILVHVGAISALNLLGLSHYLRLGEEPKYLFSPRKQRLPKWFLDHSWDFPLYHKQTDFLPSDIGLIDHMVGHMTIKISSPERAIMECIYLSPREMDLVECYQILEGLVNLQPTLVMNLLSKCNSVRVKRLFLYMAERASHQWFGFLNTEELNLGTGNRSLEPGSVYNSKYKISVPREIAGL